MKIAFKKLDHVQISVPNGEVGRARDFYCGILGLKEVARPKDLIDVPGFWLEIADVCLHIATEDIKSASRRHPAFIVENIDEVKHYLISEGVKVKEDLKIEGIKRFSLYDFWDNRIELIEKE